MSGTYCDTDAGVVFGSACAFTRARCSDLHTVVLELQYACVFAFLYYIKSLLVVR
jgi:hypothetical protein